MEEIRQQVLIDKKEIRRGKLKKLPMQSGDDNFYKYIKDDEIDS